MTAEPEDIADTDEQPFSPSIFLDLPPTPPHPDDHEDLTAATYNSYHRYTNHQAPQTSSEILSVSDNPCAANTINGGVQGTCFTLSPCFPDAALVLDDNMTWPYDPFELSEMLLSSTTTPFISEMHIVDYGEHYGFHWPTLLGFWGSKTWDDEGGPPEVRITFIGLPQPGFHPAAWIEETRRRLSTFARQCSIPFRFRCITAKWETVCADDLDINPDEVLIVNGLFHFGRSMDDEGIDGLYSPCPWDVLLGNVWKLRPHVFILCVETSLHNAPYFLGWFQEALFYYSSMFDMMDAAAPRDNEQRLLVEQDLFGRRVLNAVACEGFDRVERPETYKQWQAQNERAGLRQLPLDPDVVKAVREKVRDNYHRDFVIYED